MLLVVFQKEVILYLVGKTTFADVMPCLAIFRLPGNILLFPLGAQCTMTMLEFYFILLKQY